MNLTIYETSGCSRCRELAAFLDELGLAYKVVGLDEPSGLAMARCMGYFGWEAPALQMDDFMFQPGDLFDGVVLKKRALAMFLGIK